MILLAEIQILRNSICRIKRFGQLNLIGCVVPKLTINELFLGVAHWHFLLGELCPQKCQVSLRNTELRNSHQLDS